MSQSRLNPVRRRAGISHEGNNTVATKKTAKKVAPAAKKATTKTTPKPAPPPSLETRVTALEATVKKIQAQLGPIGTDPNPLG